MLVTNFYLVRDAYREFVRAPASSSKALICLAAAWPAS
jgi:hypothetical protein